MKRKRQRIILRRPPYLPHIRAVTTYSPIVRLLHANTSCDFLFRLCFIAASTNPIRLVFPILLPIPPSAQSKGCLIASGIMSIMRREILLTLLVFDGTYQSMCEEEKVSSKCLPVSQRSIQRNASAKCGEMETQLCPWRQKRIVARFGLCNFFYRRYTRANGSIRQVAGRGGTILAATDLRGFCGSLCIAPPSFLSVVSFIDQTLPSNI